MAQGDKLAADAVLHELVEKFPENQVLLDKADAMSDVPKSEEGRRKVAEMTKSGIGYFESGEYRQAIETFKNAIGIFPSHIGLNLNLIQTVIAEVKHNGDRIGFENLCRTSLNCISMIDPKNPQYTRCNHLSKQVDELFKFDLESLGLDL